MGQRSQIYIRIWYKNKGKYKLYAKHYDWNCGEDMISRARYGIGYIKSNLEYINNSSIQEKINRFFDVNFDMRDIALTQNIILECFGEDYDKSNEYIFERVENNDGKLFVDITKDKKIRYCFTDCNLKVLTPIQYMNWDCPEWKNYQLKNVIQTCKDNIDYINKNAEMMTKEELRDFIGFVPSKQISELEVYDELEKD